MTASTQSADRLYRQRHEADVCVVGGGMSGLCAAIAAARHGARTILIHDRPMLGGNASSEVRMWICGAHGKHNKETGLVEEIQLENCYRNPSLNYHIWDGVLYEAAFFQPNLTTLLNCSCTDARSETTTGGSRITSISAWQLTSQTWHTITAKRFIDCSGDSILAGVTDAEYRLGREARDEFNEDIEPSVPDDKVMGNSLLIQIRRTDEPQPFIAPRWAYKFERPEDLPHRMRGVDGTNFWWIEVGGCDDTIGDAEKIRDELMKMVYGVWDYIKNRAPEREKARNWAIDWIGVLPGKRENRRFVGDHILTQNDIRDAGRFHDTVAFGGWTMDDHHPAGLLYPGKPTIHHPAPSPFGIPYRCLYSRNVENLLFAGRNISVTHAALSATRVMGTCSVLGQAAGTAAAIGVRHGCSPRQLYHDHLAELQQALMEDDCFLPGFTRRVSELARQAELCGDGQGMQRLLDGMDRDRPEASHAWEGAIGASIEYRWAEPVHVGGVRMVFDSNLDNNKRMPCSYPQMGDRCLVPGSLVKSYRLEACDAEGTWRTVHSETCNYQRLVRVPVDIRVTALRLVPESTWGDEQVRIFGFEPMQRCEVAKPTIADGPTITEVRAAADPSDLEPPESDPDDVATKRVGHSA